MLSDNTFASGEGFCKVIVWNLAKRESFHILEGHDDRIVSLAKHNDTYFTSGSWDDTIRIWNS